MKIAIIATPILDYVDGKKIPIGMDAERAFPPYGTYLLAATAQAYGHEVQVIDLIALGTSDISDYIENLGAADLIGISATSLSWPCALECIRDIRSGEVQTPIVLGGVHPTLFDVYILRNFPVDYVIRGEGEVALLALCDALAAGLEPKNVPNLTYKSQNGDIVQNPMASALTGYELACGPLPSFEKMPDGIYKGLPLESSRGCPFDCAFCSTSYRRSWRPMPARMWVDRLVNLLPHLKRTTAGVVQVVDDEFSVNTKRVSSICEELVNRDIRANLVFDSRIEDVAKEEYVASVAPYTHQFLVGAECGYDEGLVKIGKKTSCSSIARAAQNIAAYGISNRCDFSFVIGFPWENLDNIYETIDFGCLLHAKYGVRVMFQWYSLIPGSRLWESARRTERVNEAFYDSYGFFRDLYLFREAVKLSPREIEKVTIKLSPIMAFANVFRLDGSCIEYRHPKPIFDHFPSDVLEKEAVQPLDNLRAASKSARQSRKSVKAKQEPIRFSGCIHNYFAQQGLPSRGFSLSIEQEEVRHERVN